MYSKPVSEVPLRPILLKPEEFLSEISHAYGDTETLVFLLIQSKQELCSVVVKFVGSGYCPTELSTA